MGRRREPPTLYQSTLQKLIIVIEEMKCDIFSYKNGQFQSYFNRCPSLILTDILKVFKNYMDSNYDIPLIYEKLLHKQLMIQLEFVINCNQPKLEFKRMDTNVTSKIILDLSLKGEHITELLMCDIVYDKRLFITAIKNLHNLLRFNLEFFPSSELRNFTDKTVDDDILRAIGNSCRKLRILKICCYNVTEKALMDFARNDLPLQMLTLNLNNENHINISYYTNSIVFLLERIKTLKYLKVENLTEAIIQFYDRNPNISLNLEYYEGYFYDYGGDKTIEILHKIVRCCPLLTHMRVIKIYINIFLILKAVMPLKYLKCINIGELEMFRNGLRLTSDSLRIKPRIKGINLKIERLDISCDIIDIGLVDECFPLLEHLMCNLVYDKNILCKFISTKPLQKLKTLGLYFIFTTDIRSNIIDLLSVCENLETVYIKEYNDQFDEILECVLKINPFKHLRIIECRLFRANRLDGLKSLLSNNNDLEAIQIHYAKAKDEQQRNDLKVLAYNHNVPVKIVKEYSTAFYIYSDKYFTMRCVQDNIIKILD